MPSPIVIVGNVLRMVLLESYYASNRELPELSVVRVYLGVNEKLNESRGCPRGSMSRQGISAPSCAGFLIMNAGNKAHVVHTCAYRRKRGELMLVGI